MGLIVRPPKTGGSSKYQTEVAAGALAILDTEVDQDLDTIYNLVNGNISNDNVSGTAAIDYAKLNLTGRIKGADLQASPPFTLPAGTVIPPLSVDKTMMKIGASIWSIDVSHSPGGAFGAAEVVLNDFTFTSRGGLAVIIATLQGTIVQSAAGSGNYQARLLLDGVEIAKATSSAGLVGFVFSGGAEHFMPLSTTVIGWNFTFGTLPTGSRHVQLAASFAGVAGITAAANSTAVYVLEPS
jgi:hypothetical protein